MLCFFLNCFVFVFNCAGSYTKQLLLSYYKFIYFLLFNYIQRREKMLDPALRFIVNFIITFLSSYNTFGIYVCNNYSNKAFFSSYIISALI